MGDDKILIIEDDEDTCMLYRQILANNGLLCELKHSASEVEAYLASNEVPSLVLMDLSVPGLDPEKFLEQMRATPRLADVPVLLVSGRDELEERAKRLGAVGGLMKPVDVQELLAKVRQFRKSNP